MPKLNRLAAVVVVLFLFISTSIIIAPPTNAAYLGTNPPCEPIINSAVIGEMEVYNLDFEKEPVGEWDYAPYRVAKPTINASLAIEQINGDKVLKIEAEYKAIEPLYVELFTEHQMQTFNFSFNWKPMSVTSTYYPPLAIQLYPYNDTGGLTGYNYWAIILRTNVDTHNVRIGNAGPSYDVVPEEWNNIKLQCDVTAGTAAVFINDVYKSTVTWPVVSDLSRVWMIANNGLATGAGSACKMYLDDIKFTIPKHTVQPIGSPFSTASTVSMVSDDGFDMEYNSSYQILKQYGFAWTSAVSPGKVGTMGATYNYLTWGQIQEMFDYGWEFAGHGYNHEDNFPALAPAERAVIYPLVYRSFIENVTGLDGLTTWVWPSNNYNEATQNEVLRYFDSVSPSTNTRWDLNREFWGNVDKNNLNVRLTVFGATYSKYAALDRWTHYGVTGNLQAANLTAIALELYNRGSSISSVENGFIPYRNWWTAEVTGEPENFALSHLHDYIVSDTWLEISKPGLVYGVGDYYHTLSTTFAKLPDGQYAPKMTISPTSPISTTVKTWNTGASGHGTIIAEWTSSGHSQTTFSIDGLSNETRYQVKVDGEVVSFLSDEGSFTYDIDAPTIFQIVVWDPYSSMGLVFAIIPLVVIASVVPMIMGIGRKLK